MKGELPMVNMPNTLEEFIKLAKELRAAADAAERELMEFLCEVEQRPSIWQGTGRTFNEVIEMNHLVKVIRFEAYKRMRDKHSTAELQVGVNAIVAADGLKPDVHAQRDVLAEAQKWEEANGTTISEQSAERIARDAKQRDASARTRHRSYPTLVAENERLRRELAAANTKIAALRAEVKKLRVKKRPTRAAGAAAAH